MREIKYHLLGRLPCHHLLKMTHQSLKEDLRPDLPDIRVSIDTVKVTNIAPLIAHLLVELCVGEVGLDLVEVIGVENTEVSNVSFCVGAPVREQLLHPWHKVAIVPVLALNKVRVLPQHLPYLLKSRTITVCWEQTVVLWNRHGQDGRHLHAERQGVFLFHRFDALKGRYGVQLLEFREFVLAGKVRKET